MRIVFIGSVAFSARALTTMIDAGAHPVGVVTKSHSSFNADFHDLAPICREHGVPFLHVEDVNSPSSLAWIADKRPDIIFCFGWSNLIKRRLLDLPPKGVVGFHPAALPQNRGRHPIIWALALGLTSTASTFFFMDEGADSGDILSQAEIPISYTDNAASLYEKITEQAMQQIVAFLPLLADGLHPRRPQEHSLANVWRKRSAKDGLIDFRMSGCAIYNLVRALSEPYVGAHLEYNGQTVKIWEVREEACGEANLEPGKVLRVEEGTVLVKCSDGAVRLCRHDFPQLPQEGEYL